MGNAIDLVQKIAKLLQTCSETPFLDARFFCEHYQNSPTEACIADFIYRRKQGEPVSKIIGKRGFWKRDFIVSTAVLDPRPDSETLIEAVLQTFPDKKETYNILDIGTGSGCLLLSLLDEYPHARGVGVDKSGAALDIAARNNTTERAQFYKADFMTDSFPQTFKHFDIIISNPPYIRTQDIETLDIGVRSYDPLIALDGGRDGLVAYRRLAQVLPEMLQPKGGVFFEIGQGQSDDVCALMAQSDFECAGKFNDLNSIIRVLIFFKK